MGEEAVHMEGSRLSTLEGKIAHTDDRVGAIERGVARMQSTQAAQTATLEKIADKVNTPAPTTNWIGVVTAVIALVTVLGAGVMLVVNPLRDRQEAITSMIMQDNERERHDAYDQGVYITSIENLQKASKHLDEVIHKIEVDVTENKIANERNRTSIKAVGDYAKEHVAQHTAKESRGD